MGNENSTPLSLGKKLSNDIEVQLQSHKVKETFPSRDGHCASSIANKLYIYGGVEQRQCQTEDESCIESNNLFELQYDTLEWKIIEATGEIPTARVGATLSTVGDCLYLIGGLNQEEGWHNSVYKFETISNEWHQVQTTGNPPSARDKTSAAVIGKQIFVFGGFGPKDSATSEDEDIEDEELPTDQVGADFGRFNDMFVFDTECNTWSKLVQENLSVPTARAASAMCAVDKYLIIVGGKDEIARLNDIHVYDTEENQWLTDLQITGRRPQPCSFHSLTAVGDRAVLIGGLNNNDQHLNEIHIFDPKTRQWLQPNTSGTALRSRCSHSATVVNNQLVIYGGSGFNKEAQCMEQFNDIIYISTDNILVESEKSEILPSRKRKADETSSNEGNELSPSAPKTSTR